MSEYSDYSQFYESKERFAARKIDNPAEQTAVLASIEQKSENRLKDQSKKEKQEEGESKLRLFFAKILALEEKSKSSDVDITKEIAELKKDIFSARSSIVEKSYLADWDRRDEVNEENKDNPIPDKEAFKQKHQKLQDLRERRKAYETLILRLARLEVAEKEDDSTRSEQSQEEPGRETANNNEAINFKKEIEEGADLIAATQEFLDQLEARKAGFFTEDESLKNSLIETFARLSDLFAFDNKFQNNTDFFSKQLDRATSSAEYALMKEKLEQAAKIKDSLLELEKKLKSFFSNLIHDIENNSSVENAIKAFAVFNLPESTSSTIGQELKSQLVDVAFKLVKNLLQDKFNAEVETTPPDQIENRIQDLINEYFTQNFSSLDQEKVESLKRAVEPKIKKSLTEEKNAFDEKRKIQVEKEAANLRQEAEKEKAKQKWTELLDELRNKENELAELLRISNPELITGSGDTSIFEGYYKQLMDLISQIKSQIGLGSGFLEEAKQEKSRFASDSEYVKSKNSFESEIQIAKSRYQFALGRFFTLASILPSSNSNEDQRQDLALLGLSFSELKKESAVPNNYLLDTINKRMPGINLTLENLITSYQADPSKTDLFNFFQYLKSSDIYELSKGIAHSLEEVKTHLSDEGRKFFDYSLREAYSNRIYYDGARANNPDVQSKMKAKHAELGLTYDLKYYRALLSDEPNASEIRIDRDMFIEGQKIFHELAGVGLYDSKTINRDTLMCYKMRLLAGTASEPSDWGSAGGLAEPTAFAFNEQFNLAGLFNISGKFNAENQTCPDAGKLQKVIALMVKYMRDADGTYGEKYYVGRGPYEKNLVTQLIDQVFTEESSLFANDSEEVIDFYKEMVLFKASRDNLYQEYALEALGQNISALKGNIKQEPRPHGVLMSMIYQLVRGKEAEAHTAMLEIVDLSKILDGRTQYKKRVNSDGTFPLDSEGKPIFDKITVPGFANPPNTKTSAKKTKTENFQAVRDNEKRYFYWLNVSNVINSKVGKDRYTPISWDKDFPSISWFVNQIHSKSTDATKKDSIVTAAEYVSAESALTKIIDTAITGIKPEDITDTHVGALLNTMNSQFSILMALTGPHETTNPLDYTIELALSAYKVLIKNILINVPGNRSTVLGKGLDREGENYENNFNRIYSIIETYLGTGSLRLKQTFSEPIRAYLNARKENFKQYNNTRDLITRVFDPNITDQLAIQEYNRFIFDHMPWLTPWARFDTEGKNSSNPNGEKGKFLGLFETISVTKFGRFIGTEEVQFAKWDEQEQKLIYLRKMQDPEAKARFMLKKPENPLSYDVKTVWASSYQSASK